MRLRGLSRVVCVDLALVEETGSLGSVIETALAIAASRAETGGELDDGILGCVFAVSNVSNTRYGVMWMGCFEQIRDLLKTR